MQIERTSGVAGGNWLLVVDDDEASRQLVVDGLKASGYQARGVSDGVDALVMIEREGLPRLVVLDLSMPHMNGWEFLEEVWDDSEMSRIPVVVVTASSRAHVPQADALLFKPVAFDELLKVVRDEIGPG